MHEVVVMESGAGVRAADLVLVEDLAILAWPPPLLLLENEG